MPLRGGTVLDLAGMDAIQEITKDGVAVCGPGTRLGTLETARFGSEFLLHLEFMKIGTG